MRLFFASFLGSDLMRSYESLVADLAAEVPDALRSVPKGTQHITLAFLGEIEDSATIRELKPAGRRTPFESAASSLKRS